MRISNLLKQTLPFLMITAFCGCSAMLKMELKDRNESEIWQQVRDNTGHLTDFFGHTELTVESGYMGVPVEAKIYYRAPDWITLRTYGPMGLKLLEASLQKNQFQVYSVFTNEYFTGCLDSVDVSRRFKLPLPGLDLRSAWQDLFNPQKPEGTMKDLRKSGRYYILTYPINDGWREVWIDGRKMLIARENILDKEGILKYYLSYDKYKSREQVRFPRKIEMGDIDRGVKLTIATDKFKVNSDIAESDMMLSVPPEAKRMKLE